MKTAPSKSIYITKRPQNPIKYFMVLVPNKQINTSQKHQGYTKQNMPPLKTLFHWITSESCDFAISTRILAAGWMMSRSFMIVAPSLEIVTFPLSSWINLSIPRGPSVVRTTSATAVHALMLLTNCAFPCDVSVPSFSNMIWGCCSLFPHFQWKKKQG